MLHIVILFCVIFTLLVIIHVIINPSLYIWNYNINLDWNHCTDTNLPTCIMLMIKHLAKMRLFQLL